MAARHGVSLTAVVELDVAGPVEPWTRIGLDVVDDTAWIGGIALRFGRSAQSSGITGWTLLDALTRSASIDGLPTSHAEIEPRSDEHPLGATAFDHVVVMTSSLERTCGAIEEVTGEPLKRVREAGAVRQGFHRLGPIIVEVVETAQVRTDAAMFWGFSLVADDIHESTGRLGPETISRPKTAVQPGRLIASFRDGAGLGLPVALMSR